ncbi:MAG TPA: cytochrome b/b6 domain-containing protein [Acetobacteraceae bacterium]|nr:cytochrome b/b6 domain-containing protein [Acetobacteraceae bacterium]
MSEATVPVRIWDIPIRLFHWAIVIILATSWISEEQGWMELHFLAGYSLLALLLFRLAWGFVGSHTARFTSFLRSPLTVVRYISRLHRREPDTELGHNAAGGWMALVMLVLLAVQVGTGLCANDDVMNEGPLFNYVGKDWSDWLSHIHAVNFTLIQIVASLHVLAILAYALVKKHDLVRPMVTGLKRLPIGTTPPRLASPLLALLLFAIAIAAVALLVTRA